MGDGGLAAQEDGGEVDLLDALPGVEPRLQDGVVVGRGDPGVVEGDVDAAVGVPGGPEQCLDLLGVGDVDVHEEAAGLLGGGLAAYLVHVRADDVRALGGEPAGGGEADAAAGSGDHGGTAGEPAADDLFAHVRSGLRADEDVLGFGEGGQRVRAELAPDPGLLEPAEGVQ
ncbi:hypothetical protein SHKM778_64410 [Streptomyces sp. KM77-8]|uniref:Uncharacterized protein n=1 Tax=Streptomyces haneummycinicus TaxID=3074435 RepID=A0AAT9HR16_9ACTN